MRLVCLGKLADEDRFQLVVGKLLAVWRHDLHPAVRIGIGTFLVMDLPVAAHVDGDGLRLYRSDVRQRRSDTVEVVIGDGFPELIVRPGTVLPLTVLDIAVVDLHSQRAVRTLIIDLDHFEERHFGHLHQRDDSVVVIKGFSFVSHRHKSRRILGRVFKQQIVADI